jgi:hypothetical protein
MITRTPHHDRAIGSMRVLDVSGRDDTPEAPVPRERLFVDTIRLTGDWEGVAEPYARHIRRRRMVIEVTGRSLTLRAGVTALAKGYVVLNEHLTGLREGPRPELLIIADTAQQFVASLGAESVAPGMSVAEPHGLLRVVVLELARVPLENGTTGLHMMRWPSNTEGELVVQRFFDDPTVPESVKLRMHEAMMAHSVVNLEDERWHSAEWVRELGRSEGVAEGKAEGRREGKAEGRREGKAEGRRDAVLAMARRLLGDERADELARIEDIDALEDAVAQAITTSR